MHPAISSLRALAWYVGVWLVVGGLLAWGLVGAGFAAWSNALWFALPVAVGFGFVVPSAFYVCRAVPAAQRRFLVGMATFIVAASVAASFTWVTAMTWNQLCLVWRIDWAGMVIPPALSTALWIGSAGLFVISLLVHDVMITLDQVRQAQQRELQSRALARDAELQLLRAQVNPHFLFNSLNSISALTNMDPGAARSMTIALAQYFRQTLSLSSHTTIPLAHEVAHCQCFLNIEMQRFGPKLRVDVQMDEVAGSALVPPMLVQPLVENAVKHGIANSIHGGTVRIRAAVRGAWLHLTIDNPVEADTMGCPHARVDAPGSRQRSGADLGGLGLGLRTTQQRLRGLYGDQARIAHHIAPNADAAQPCERFVVELTLPFQPASNAAPGAHPT